MEKKVKKNVTSKEYQEERQTLDDKVKYLETILYKCVKEKEKLDTIFGKQKFSLDKAGLGYNSFKKKTFSKTKYGSSSRKSQILWFYCHKIGHIASRYYSIQKYILPSNALPPKRSLKANPQGPNMIWVPKVKWTN